MVTFGGPLVSGGCPVCGATWGAPDGIPVNQTCEECREVELIAEEECFDDIDD